jgi:hypothetical protein
MRKNLFARTLLLLVLLLDNTGIKTAHGIAPNPVTQEFVHTANAGYPEISVELSTPARKVIRFDTSTSDETTAAESREIPHLVLTRNGILTAKSERSLEIVVQHVPVSTAGALVSLAVFTQHGDPDHEGKDSQRIQVWSGERFITQTDPASDEMTVKFLVTFDRHIQHEGASIKTPTDYFQYQISVVDSQGTLKYKHTENYAFLMENQQRVPLPNLLELEPDSAPDSLLVYYCDMIPFQADKRNPFTRIPRSNIEQYIRAELIPAMLRAIRIQNEWGFMWYPEWRNFRSGEDPKTLSVALGEYGVWYHGAAPSLGNSMISIRVDGSAGDYENLTDGLISIFHHELFHNLQRNMDFHFGNSVNVSGKDEAWQMFSEGTAVLASAVGQPQVQFSQDSAMRSYMKRANAFIGSEGIFGGGLNKSYEKIPYNTVAYWRFLYEKCGGVNKGMDDPAAGMGVIRSVLETLYKGEVVDIHASTNWTEYLPLIMDRALAQSPACPFRDYETSLSEFAHSIYMLRLEAGRCDAATHDHCGFYDPYSLYNTPPFESVSIAGWPAVYINGNIPTSYGIDFIELTLDSSTSGQSFQITFDKSSVSQADFTVQVMLLKSGELKPVLAKESELLNTKAGRIEFETGNINLNEFDCLGLLITRIDSNEQQDAAGSYTIQVRAQ